IHIRLRSPSRPWDLIGQREDRLHPEAVCVGSAGGEGAGVSGPAGAARQRQIDGPMMNHALEPGGPADVLIVEDDPGARETFEHILRLNGYAVRVAPDA